ncbi:DNA polymerase IV [Bacteroidetes bacterium UKL13-3]|jgi:DNA polymerase-4|nr:DNA polymerase IV [Bacteroidetes bacterium UKL13-3]HCP92805.1 DNA polymerase IV [Bacteroidota bacterium]
MNHSIVHIDLDSFFVSVERLVNPKLIGKPVLVGGSSDRGVVASCSYEAREFGIHSAMPMRQARLLCPEAIIVRGDTSEYSKYSNMITEIIAEEVPMYEKTSIDEFYMDLTGMDKFFGCYKLATELRQRIIRETNLPISFAMSANKTVSKVGTGEAKPNGQKEILFGTEKEFLAPLSIKKIPMVGDKTYQLLRGMGVMWIRTLQEMPMELLQQVLGDNGSVIWRKAQGIDNSPVVPYSERKSISTERTFEQDTIDVKMLKGLLIGMTEKLAYQLRSEQKLTACVTVKIRYSDFNTYTMQARITYTSLDHILIDKVKELFDKLYQKRMLIRLIGIKFSHLVQGGHQYNLFDQTPEQIQLYMAMDKIRKRYGDEAVARAVGTDFKRTKMNSFNGIKR